MLPLAGRVAAGRPIEAVPQSDLVEVPESMIARRGRTYALRVKGDSMLDEQIRDGDLVIIEERETAENGEVVVALVDGTDVTLKKFHREGARVRLQPANAALHPLVLEGSRVRVQGVVVGVIRHYR
jgi:repressor LexA